MVDHKLVPAPDDRAHRTRWGRPPTTIGLLVAVALIGCIALASKPFRFPPATAGERPAERYEPFIAPTADDAASAVDRIRLGDDLAAELVAAEPLLANPVAFTIDEQGRFYVAETHRLHAGVTDIRRHMDWLDDDLAARTVADRVEMYRRQLGDAFESYGWDHDRVRRLTDTNGDGRLDSATVFADGFNAPADGIGAGLLARRGRVWFACIPHLWLLEDTDGDGRADIRQSLHSGFGVHVGYLGHDLHGLQMGPDGMLYFSIGDRGLSVEAAGGTLDLPDTGAVLRCYPDGTGLEIVATGLRNPQELVFDEWGNLFTGDNNSDAGDRARWVWVVEGGDSGWRYGYQHLNAPRRRGPWNAERLWMPHFAEQAAYIVPPLANLGDGPSGLTYDPGWGLPDRCRGRFFLCDFRGTAALSGIRSFALRPQGASFELVDDDRFAWMLLATDADFGFDGALYVTDWVDGWDKPNRGRIVRIAAPGWSEHPLAREVPRLMAEGFIHRNVDELLALLSHVDRRVRQEAQFALAERGDAERVPAALAAVAASADESQLARVHAIWALGQIARTDRSVLAPLVVLLGDPAAEIRAQVAGVLGRARYAAAFDPLLATLSDAEPRVQFFAAQAVGRLGRPESTPALLRLLADNADRDPYLRHAAVMGLVGSGDVPAWLAAGESADAPRAVRMGVLLALRRRAHPQVARFLSDDDPALVLEAARAIYDLPIEAALPQLAALIEVSPTSEDLAHRVINANLHLAGAERATALARLAAGKQAGEAVRLEALECLAHWGMPSPRDRVLGCWRPLAERPSDEARAALRGEIETLLADFSDAIRARAVALAGQYALVEAVPRLRRILSERSEAEAVRVAALDALVVLDAADLEGVVRPAIDDSSEQLRGRALARLAELAPDEALDRLNQVLAAGSLGERQVAWATVASLPPGRADDVLAAGLDRLLAGELPGELALDLIEAAAARPAGEVVERLARLEASRATDDPLAGFRETLVGGDAERGRAVFMDKAEVACLRCHQVQNQGGQVGPALNGIGGKKDREYLLEAIVAPNRAIAEGFETVVLELDDGRTLTGIVKQADDESLTLTTFEDRLVKVPQSAIVERARGQSAMPDDLPKQLTLRELRDLVEYLASLK